MEKSLIRIKRGLLTILSFASVAYSISYSAANSSSFSELSRLVLDCLNSEKGQVCRDALLEVEYIQSRAAAQRNYSCQTYSLGLGSDLILTRLAVDRSVSVLIMLEKVKELCPGV